MVRRLNIDGDGQGDLRGHGGEQRAVMVYQADSYRYWEAQLKRSLTSYGQFGENLTVDGLADNEVCIGDRYRIGSALFEVTQPRVTCYRVGIRMDEPQMAALLVAHHRPGFYFRVLEEGEVSAGDEIVKVADGPERMTVAEIDALLYLPGHPRDQLERALRIPALSPGWQTSFQSLLAQQMGGQPLTGNPGLAPADQLRPSTPGFRSLRVSRIDRESSSVFSLTLVPTDALPLAAALPGQFVVLRLRPKPDEPPLLRSYSLSRLSSPDAYRVSVKEEINGAASSYLRSQVRIGDVLDVSTPRGNFTLRPGNGPVVLLSAGIGATPVLAMLHALASEGSARVVWWLFGARSGTEHPFARESRDLLRALPHARSYVQHSRPRPEERIGIDFDASGHLTVSVLERLGVPLDADFYICGPTAFLRDITNGLAAVGVTADRIHREVFGPGESTTPGVVNAFHPPPHQPAEHAGPGPSVSFGRSGITTQWGPAYQSLLELAEACDVPVRWSCRTGVCHTCESGLVSGTVRYAPEPLEPPAPGNVLICCSQPLDSVVIDL